MVKLTKTIEYLFYLFIFLLPWQTRLIWHEATINGFTWEYGRFSLYGTELMLWVVLVLYLFWLIKSKRLASLKLTYFFRRFRQSDAILYWLVVLFLVLSGLSIGWALDGQLAYYGWIRLLEGGALFSLLVTFNFELRQLAVVWVGSAAVQSVFAIWQFFNQYVFGNKWLGLAWQFPTQGGSIILQTDTERWLRAYGSLSHPNILGGFLVIALLFLLYLAFLAKDRSQRIFVLVSLLVITPALFFSFSRSAWVALLVVLIGLAFWLNRHKQLLLNKTFYKIFLLLMLMVVILGWNLTDPLVTRILGQEPLEVSSINLRLTFTQQAWGLIQLHPWLGTGIGNYTLGVYQYINNSWPGYYYQPVHNIYLLIMAELGISGAVVFGVVTLLLFNLLIKQKPSLEKTVVFFSLLAVLVISLFDHYFWSFYSGIIIFWVIFGLNFRQLRPPVDNS